MKKIFYLKSCDTCRRILKEIPNLEQFELQEIKSTPITLEQLESLREKTNSYESLFNKRAQLYKSRGLKDQNLQENDYKALILEHYTFLSRPVILIGESIFIGNNKKTIESALLAL